MCSFFTGKTQINTYLLWTMESNYYKGANSIYLKLGTHIIGHRSIHCIDFGEFRFNSFIFYRGTKKFLIHYSLWSQAT